MRHLGDFAPATVLYFMFTTYRPSSGAAYTLAGSPVVRVYKNGSTTQHTTTYNVTADFDSIAGLNYFTIDTSADGTFYAAGGMFTCVLEAGTVDSVSIVGTVVGTFTLNATAALRPTTAGRTLDVSSGGEAGVDWANVGSPSTTVNLSGTTVKTATDVETDTADIQSRLPAALVSGRIDASVGAMASAVLTATAIASDAITAAKVAADVTTELQSGLATASALSTVAGYLDTEIAAILADTNELQTDLANGGRIDLLIDAIKAKTDNLPASPAATGDIPTAGAVADAVWDEILSGHAVSGSTGEALAAAGGAGDPWITALPGSYSSGQAGYILGTYLDAAVSTRSTYAGGDTAGTTTLLSRLTATRAGYLDNLSGGAVALASSILDAAGLRSALGLASANLDTQLDALPTANENADALLGRNVAGGSSSGRTVSQALYFLRNRWTISGGTLTVYGTDDTTSSWTASITQAAGDPVSASDPA